MDAVPDQLRCKYNGGMCPNPRAQRKNGRPPLRVCEFHRRRANAHQKDYQRRRKSLAKAAVGGRVTHSTFVPKPTVQVAPESASSPSGLAARPLVVFVLATEKQIGESIQQLSTARDLCVGQPFQVVPAGQLSGFLRGIDAREAIPKRGGGSTKAEGVEKSQPEPPCRQATEANEPLCFDPCVDQTGSLLSDKDDDFVKSLFADVSWSGDSFE